MRDRSILILIFLAVGTACAWLFRHRLGELSSRELERVIYLSMAALLVGGGVWAGSQRLSGAHWLRNLLIWVAVFAGVTFMVASFAPSFR